MADAARAASELCLSLASDARLVTSFALKTLFADRRKLLIAMTGVIFSLVLVNIQGGMFLGMVRKSTLLIDRSGADIWVGHRGVQNADITADIPTAWLHRVRGVAGVERAEPYIVQGAMIRLPSGGFESVLVVGMDPASMLGGPWAFAEGDLGALRAPSAITVDRLDGPRLGDPEVGDVLEINRRRAKIAAKTEGIVGFITTPYVFTTLTLARAYTSVPPDRCSFFLVKGAPGADPERLAREIQQRLPDADVHVAGDFSRMTQRYWISRTGLGLSFGSSTLLGLAVGLIMVAQSLYAFVVDHLEHYAALKAIGANDFQIGRVLLIQGVTIATLGCLLGHAVSWILWALISSPQLSIVITPTLLAVATLLAGTLCVVSALLPLRRIRAVDPVTVLQG